MKNAVELFACKNQLQQKVEEQTETLKKQYQIIQMQSEKLKEAKPFGKLMMQYRCAIMEVETKLKVLNDEFTQTYNRNPFESIQSRLKTPESIYEKMRRKGYPVTVKNIESSDLLHLVIQRLDGFGAGFQLRHDLLRVFHIFLVLQLVFQAGPKVHGDRDAGKNLFFQNHQYAFRSQRICRCIQGSLINAFLHYVMEKTVAGDTVVIVDIFRHEMRGDMLFHKLRQFETVCRNILHAGTMFLRTRCCYSPSVV